MVTSGDISATQCINVNTVLAILQIASSNYVATAHGLRVMTGVTAIKVVNVSNSAKIGISLVAEMPVEVNGSCVD